MPVTRTAAPRPTLSRRRLVQLSLAASAALLLKSEPGIRTVGAQKPAPDPRLTAVSERVRRDMALLQVPGVALGIYAGGEPAYVTLGVTNIEQPLAVDTDTFFQIGSVTKTYTALALLRLVEQGRVDLEAPVRRYLLGLRLADEAAAARITSRNLLTHTGGFWGDAFLETGRGDDALARLVERLPTFPQIVEPDTLFSYNNAGFSVAGRLIEVVTGTTYERAMEELVLGPLGLTRSEFFAEDVITERVAAGHAPGADGPAVVRPWALPRHMNPAGGIVSTVRDQMAYARFWLGDGRAAGGERLITAETLARMTSPQGPGAPPAFERVGLGWLLLDAGGLTIIAHPGDTFGQNAETFLIPELNFAMVLLANSPSGSALASRALLVALREYAGLPLPEPPDDPAAEVAEIQALPALPLTLAQLAEYTGRYATPAAELDFRVEEGRLIASGRTLTVPDQAELPEFMQAQQASVEEAVALKFIDEDLALIDAPEGGGVPLQFVRRPDGSVGWIRAGARLTPKVA